MNELAVTKPAELYRTSTDVAGLCKEFVVNSAINIQGRKFVKVEGWQSIAAAHGCIAEIEYVKETNVQGINGIEACALLRRMSDGAVISRANGFVGQDEKNWPDRAVYARYAMAQTRATSRVCRNAFAYVVVMMNAGLETTPAEEVPSEGFTDRQPVVRQIQSHPLAKPELVEAARKFAKENNPVESWAKETKAAIASAKPESNGQDTVTGILGKVTPSADGGVWYIESIGDCKKGLWTRDKELAYALKGYEGAGIVAHLQSKKAGSYRVVSFESIEVEEPNE